MEKDAKATGGRIITNIDDLNSEDLGYTELIKKCKIGDDKMVWENSEEASQPDNKKNWLEEIKQTGRAKLKCKIR